ncbi:MAG: tRNA (adenosine(37)-N6)-threonylcarbamoyltransferase complex dimerization subunit type 1 TsaB [Spirochaetales bacterium]|nr:tRNA (adenosine(37)-N6)-threonylcarbamoyltransferase complex dimerization subunit type 1 TsaB [Spirochaetales bacterium]
MNILSLDTSTPVLSLSLRTSSSYEERKIIGNFSHSENLLGEIKSMTKRAGIELKDLELLICTKGPGSFTGLRVGMAGLKGISLASSAPLVSVPTLSVIEESVKSLWKGPIVSVIDAKKKKFYFRLSVNDEVVVSDRDGNPEDLTESISSLKDVLITGPDAALFASKLLAISPELDITVDKEAPRCLSYALEKLGKEKLEKDGPDDIGEGPVYIRRSDAEEMLMAKAKEAKGE